MMSHCTRRSEAGFLTLIELLVVAAIILTMAYLFLGGHSPGSRQVEKELGPARPGGPETIPGRSIEAARNVECKNNLAQLRQALQMRSMESDKPPASLGELRLPPQMLSCPVTHNPYVYDPDTGKVHCTTPRHEQY
jgi:type II secretory pathway pseudopilin PulG